jgi:membrane-associated phospholipid phosphatase
MKHITKLLFLLSIGISTGTFAQDTIQKKDTTKVDKIVQLIIKDTTKRKETKKDSILEKKLQKSFYGIPQFAQETYLFVATPTRWHEADWLRVGVTLAAVAAIMPFDQTINKAMQGNQHYYYSVPVVAGRVYGEWYSIGAVTAVFGGFGILAHDTAAKKIAIELLQAGAYSELFTEVLKIGVGRTRPYENVGAFKFHPFNLNNNTESMPSGHSTSAFALSTVMFRHAHSTFLKILAFVPAGLTVFSRLYQDFHWSSDCFLGAAAGFSTGMWVVNLHERKRHKINVQGDLK